jgi:chromosomal replication initiation ATPase DnaA
VTATVATLSLEPFTLHSRRRHAASSSSGVLREYVLGPENSLVRQGIGLEETESGEMRLHFPIVPLFLHAPSGFGKSQLLHALAAVWTRQSGPDRVLFVTAADFARSAAHAQKLDDVPVFQQKYQRIDLLLIDDLDQLQRKPSAQQQLASILDRRQQQHRPTVLTARESLQALGLSARLTSRLAGGLDIPLHLPSWQTRREILEKICRQRGIQLTADAEQLLSEHPALTIPQLVGLLNGLLNQQSSPSPIASGLNPSSLNLGSPKISRSRVIDAHDQASRRAAHVPSVSATNDAVTAEDPTESNSNELTVRSSRNKRNSADRIESPFSPASTSDTPLGDLSREPSPNEESLDARTSHCDVDRSDPCERADHANSNDRVNAKASDAHDFTTPGVQPNRLNVSIATSGMVEQIGEATLIATAATTAATTIRRFDVADFSDQLIRNQPASVDPKRIIRATAQYFGLKLRNLTGTSRRKMDVLARSLAMYLIRELSGESFQQIGHHFGDRDHSTVIHACRKMAHQRLEDSETRQAILEIKKRVE